MPHAYWIVHVDVADPDAYDLYRKAVIAPLAKYGGAFIVRGIMRAFEKNLDLPIGKAGRGIVAFGVVGYIAKGIAVGVAGILFIVAAVSHDPETAGGLDAALRALTTLPFGTVILWIVGAGLVIYGLFCFARARYAKM